MTDTITEQTYRLIGWGAFEELQEPIRALLFGHMVKLAIPVVQEYLSDLYHEAHWIDENVNGETTFEFLVRHSGTNIGLPDDPGNSARIGVQIGCGSSAEFYRVRVWAKKDRHGGDDWHATFTRIPLDQVPAVSA